MKLKHVSLDIWNTLIRPRPSYGVLRSLLLAEHFQITPEHADALYKHCDKAVGLVESPDTDAIDTVIRMMHQAVGEPIATPKHLRSKLEALFVANPPRVELKVVQEMHRLTARNVTFSVTSNVGLMNGDILRQILFDQGLPLATHTFDDEVGFRKPDPMIFKVVHRNVQRTMAEQLDPGSILHIGDDAVCDIGGESLGIRCLIIEGVDDLLPVLRELQ